MTLQELVDMGFIPKDMSKDEIVDVCANKLRIGNKGMDLSFVVDMEQLDRIRFSGDFNKRKIQGEIKSQHQTVIDKYQELISGYEKMLANIGTRKNFGAEKTAINKVINHLKKEKAAYESEIGHFKADGVEQFFNFQASNNQVAEATNDLATSVAMQNESKITRADNELERLYGKLDRAKNGNKKTVGGNIKKYFNVKKLEGQIKRLRGKKGRLQTIQRNILNAKTSSYVNKMEHKFKQYMKEQNRISDSLDDKIELYDEIADYKEADKEASAELKDIQHDSLHAGALGQISIKARERKVTRDKAKIASKIAKLQAKAGSVNLSQQYSEVFQRSYAR